MSSVLFDRKLIQFKFLSYGLDLCTQGQTKKRYHSGRKIDQSHRRRRAHGLRPSPALAQTVPDVQQSCTSCGVLRVIMGTPGGVHHMGYSGSELSCGVLRVRVKLYDKAALRDRPAVWHLRPTRSRSRYTHK